MNVQFLSTSKELTLPLKTFFHRRKCEIIESSRLEEFFQNITKKPSHIFIIEAGIESEVRTLDFIRDLRTYFGAFPFIFVISKKGAILNKTNYLNVGVDDTLELPIDTGILEDLLGHAFKNDVFHPLNYRTVPSGGSQVSISRDIYLEQVNRDGIAFNSPDFISRGTVVEVSLAEVLNIDISRTFFKVVYSEETDDGDYYYFGEFFEIEPEDKKKIKFELKR